MAKATKGRQLSGGGSKMADGFANPAKGKTPKATPPKGSKRSPRT